MSGVLDGLSVLDLSTGVAGPMAAMLLCDQGASVTKIEPPGGDPTRRFSGARVWHRGKRSAVIDLAQPAGREQLLVLADRADVLLESYAPGTTARLGIDYETLAARNPRLVYCSITAYGEDTRDAARPGYDALVAARTGLQWEQRGWVGGTIARMCGRPPELADLEVPGNFTEGAAREGPLFTASTWPSLAACLLATTAITAAVRAREQTGRGQRVQTSLLQGVLAVTVGGWQRCAHPESEHYQTWVFDPRASKGEFRCADGRWVHHWVPNPRFVLGVSAGEKLEHTKGVTAPRQDPSRIMTDFSEIVVLLHYYPQLAAAFARFDAADWVDIGAEVGVALQPIRSPEEALADPALFEDGTVIEVLDPELGPLRQVGVGFTLSKAPVAPKAGAPAVGAHTAEVLAEAAAGLAPSEPSGAGRSLSAPLAGVRVLDLGLAVAGPFGTQVLADLGADVIKVNTLYDHYWQSNHIAFACNRGKRSVAINLKEPEGLALLHQLVAGADVVAHNMRYEAAERLGVDYESLRAINPSLVYCHSRGHDQSRADRAGNDQTAAALGGVSYEDGGCARGGKPIWSLTSLGDTGNGFFCAIGIICALYHRDRTGEGQFVSTAILNATLLNTSSAWLAADGTVPDRPRLDAEQTGLGALYRLYETADGWLCLAAVTEGHYRALTEALGRPELGSDLRFATAQARATHDAELSAELGAILAGRSAAEWFALLDAAGVPVEVSSPTYALGVLDDPELVERGWVTDYEHPTVGRLQQFGLLFDLSDTPGVIAGPPITVGQHTREILSELGLDAAEVDRLCAARVVYDAAVGVPS